MQAAEAFFGFVNGKGRVETRCEDAARGELIDLIFHESDQRRDDDGEAFVEDSRELEAEGFATAGGKEREGVAAGEDVADDFLLVRAEAGVAEIFFERGEKFGSGGALHCGEDLSTRVRKNKGAIDGLLVLNAALLVNRAREFRPNYHDEARIPFSGDGVGCRHCCVGSVADDFWRAGEGARFAEECAGGN